ncbi:hypothetical protein UFOVP53_47 [uncultured Caudovirales phage]|uniref:Uncharacterized protein n=1 Tax=uncultured Caudovirales phage TaxID=2100421 RepID=A0A6J5KST7_9CAUD|nr:hypothetical protein UFOVP53_47 [uncultured Caudovirales phage]
MKNKALKIDMCAGSELKDTQGETLSIEGADISELQAGRGRLNDDHGKGFFNSLGKITDAKKIFKAEDCDNERHKYYWDKIKAPYIYVAGELYNNEDHPNAKAAAAILRNIHREDVPLKLKASVEGGVMARGISDPTRLAQTKIHSVALTFTPANTATLVEPLNLDKSAQDWAADQQLIKSVMHLAETNIPSFRHIERHASANTILDNISKIKHLAKSLGVDIHVSESTPEVIMKQAAAYKIEQNIKKINELVKAIDPKTGLAVRPGLPDTTRDARKEQEQANRNIRLDTYQQNIGQAKIEAQGGPNIPIRSTATLQPKVETVPLKTGEQFKQGIATKLAATKAVRDANQSAHTLNFDEHVDKASLDPGHLDKLRTSLVSLNIHPDKINQVIGKISGAVNAAKVIKHQHLKDNLIKSMTAGFGGAGSPMDLTGGGALQSESLEPKKKSKKKSQLNKSYFKVEELNPHGKTGMQYITCDNCGDEQVYMKHQVKCRKCHRNFNFDKLKDLI